MQLTKAEIKREQILNGDITKTIFSITIPIIIYNLIIYFYGIFDLLIVGRYNIGKVESIAYINQIIIMVSTFGMSFAIGGSILVARKLGAKKDNQARQYANTIFFFEVLICIATAVIFIPFGRQFLHLFNVPSDIIDEAHGYYIVQIVTLLVMFINMTFICIEKAKGNTSILFYLNIGVVIIKIGLTFIFIHYISDITNMWLGIATLVAQLFMMVFGLWYLFRKNNFLNISFKNARINFGIVRIILALSIPMFFGRFLFSLGKVIVNAISTDFYSSISVGALAISNIASGLAINIAFSFIDTTSTMVSQNVGKKNYERTIKIFKKVLVISLIVGTVLSIVLLIFSNQIVEFLIPIRAQDLLNIERLEELKLQRLMAKDILILETIGVVMLASMAASNGVLSGYGKTKYTMIISIIRLFVFRIPPILIFYYMFKMNYKTLGWSMMISNIVAGALSLIVAIIFLRKIISNEIKFDYCDIEEEKCNEDLKRKKEIENGIN